MENIDELTEKANQLVELLREAQQIIDSLYVVKCNFAQEYKKQMEKSIRPPLRKEQSQSGAEALQDPLFLQK